MIGVRANVKEAFFDRHAVIEAIDAKTRAALIRFGSFTMQEARQSIRSRKKASAVGQPPSSHTGLLKHNIFFAFDATAKSVMIGPVLLPRTVIGKDEGVRLHGATVPSILEHGGTEIRQISVRGKKHKIGDYGHIAIGGKVNKARSVRRAPVHGRMRTVARVKLTTAAMVARADRIDQELADLNLFQFGNQATKTVVIGPRPYMAPAFNKELGVLDTLWHTA